MKGASCCMVLSSSCAFCRCTIDAVLLTRLEDCARCRPAPLRLGWAAPQQHQHAGLRPHVPIRQSIHGLASAVGGQHARDGIHVHDAGRQEQIAPACQSLIALALVQVCPVQGARAAIAQITRCSDSCG